MLDMFFDASAEQSAGRVLVMIQRDPRLFCKFAVEPQWSLSLNGSRQRIGGAKPSSAPINRGYDR